MEKEIPNSAGYTIDDKAVVRSYRLTGKRKGQRKSVGSILAIFVDKDGYHKVSIQRDNGTQRCVTVGKLLLETFVGPCPPGQIVLHKNDIKTDNSLSNLCYGTHSQNRLDQQKNNPGKHAKGEKVGSAKLKPSDIPKIRALEGKMPLPAIARQFGVRTSAIWKIVHRKTWSHIP